MKRLFALCASLLFAGALSACNTIQGVGEDISEAGERIERATDGEQ